MKHRIYYKEKTPVGLDACLLEHSFFQQTNEWKYLPAIYKKLKVIFQWNVKNQENNKDTTLSYRFWSDTFGKDYCNIVSVLEDCGLLKVKRHCRRKYTTHRKDKGQCYSYILTPKCISLLGDTALEYLYTLMTDKKEWRRNQQYISNRGYNKIEYDDTRDHLKDFIDHIEIDMREVDRLCSVLPAGKRASILTTLEDIITKDYAKMTPNVKDGRIANPYTNLPSEIRPILKVNGRPLAMTIDVRSCYPSLFAVYLLSIVNSNPSLLSSSYLSPIYDYGKDDILVECDDILENGYKKSSGKLVSKTDLLYEMERYNKMFLDKSNDPKDTLSRLLDIDRNIIKQVLIEYYNGHKVGRRKNDPFRKYDVWLKTEFPVLYSIWQKTDKKQTGNNIGKYFETRVMLDQSIYTRAGELDIAVGYEYDGFSFFGHNRDHCNILLEFIKTRCIELLGLELVFVEKKVPSIYDFMRDGFVETRLKILDDIDAKLSPIRRKCWTLHRDHDWTLFRALKERKQSILAEIASFYGKTRKQYEKQISNEKK